jgi:hypothetical protein
MLGLKSLVADPVQAKNRLEMSSQNKQASKSALEDEWQEVVPTIYERRDRNQEDNSRWNSRPDELLDRAVKSKRHLSTHDK